MSTETRCGVCIAESDRNVIFHPEAKYNVAVDWKWETWDAWKEREGGRYEGDTRLEDPLFVDAEAMDFRLREGSPALEVGFEEGDWEEVGLPGGRR